MNDQLSNSQYKNNQKIPQKNNNVKNLRLQKNTLSIIEDLHVEDTQHSNESKQDSSQVTLTQTQHVFKTHQELKLNEVNATNQKYYQNQLWQQKGQKIEFSKNFQPGYQQ